MDGVQTDSTYALSLSVCILTASWMTDSVMMAIPSSATTCKTCFPVVFRKRRRWEYKCEANITNSILMVSCLFCNKKVNGPSANGLFSEDSWGPTGPVQRLCLSVSLSSLTPIGFKQKVYSLCLFVFLLLLLLYPYQLDPLQPIWVPLSDICTLVYKCACYP